MIPFNLAIFDLAGTTVKDDDQVSKCLVDALAEAGVEIKIADATVLMGIPKPVAISQLLERAERTGDVNVIHADFQHRMRTFYAEGPVVEIPGTTACFRALKQNGLKIAIDTGFDRTITDVLLGRMNWGELLDDSITSDEVRNGRPAPDMALALAARAGLRPHRIIKVGDTPADLGEGHSAGVGLNVGVTSGGHSRHELESHPHDVILGSVAELPNWLWANYQ